MQRFSILRPIVKRLAFLTVILGVLLQTTSAQKKSVLCQYENSLDTIRQQIELSKSIDNPSQHIATLIRAADLLWPFQEPKARETFLVAFDLALDTERDTRQQRVKTLLMFEPDQRYVVVRAVARRDTALAKKLTNRILEDMVDGKSAGTEERTEVLKAQRLLESAMQLISLNMDLSLDLARKSLGYPASHMITRFLYALATTDQQAADQFYEDALKVYADRPMREFLYLKVYPFALVTDGNMPVSGSYQVPSSFQPNKTLRIRFLRQLLRRAQDALAVPLDEGDNFNWTSGNAHILEALNVLTPFISKDLPEFLPQVTQARERILITLPIEQQKNFAEVASEGGSKQSFESRLELAEKLSNPDERFDAIVTAILTSTKGDDLNQLIKASDKIDEMDFRQALSDLIYFERAKVTISERRFDDTEKLASHIDDRLVRSHVLVELAQGLSKIPDAKTRVTETLARAMSELQKLRPSVLVVRQLLTISNLVAKTHRTRALALLSEAARLTNQIERPDFTVGDQSFEKQFGRRSNPGYFEIRFYMPGADPETAFKELANIDYDNVVTQTSIFTDAFTRAVTTLGVIGVCVSKLQQPKTSANKM